MDLPVLLAEFNVDIRDVMAGMEIGPDDLQVDNRISFSTCLRLLERSADLAACPHFGLLLGSRHDHRILGAIGQLMSHAPTLGDALLDFVGAQLGNSSGATVYIHRNRDHFVLGYGVYDRQSAGGRQLYDLGIAVGCNFVRALSGGRVDPVEVRLSHRAPKDRRPHVRVLKSTILFDQDQTCIVLPQAALSVPVVEADPAMRSRIAAAVSEAFSAELGDLPARLKHALRPQLLLGKGKRSDAGKQFGISARTLSRHLARAGTSFETVRDEVRYSVARELLELTDLPVSDIAMALSFASHSSFVHAFQRWAGLAPSRWRERETKRD